MKILSDLDFLFLIVRIQWVDRLATSSFLIGITIQTILLSTAIYSRAMTPHEAHILATKASCYTSIGILLFASMSSIQNEFRYGTIENVLISQKGLGILIFYRAVATAIILSPAILIPFVSAVFKFPSQELSYVFFIVTLIYFFIAAICYQFSYLINYFKQPMTIHTLLKFIAVGVGMRVFPIPYIQQLSLFFPSGWILGILDNEFSVINGLIGFFASIVVGLLLIQFFIKPIVESKIEEKMISGRIS